MDLQTGEVIFAQLHPNGPMTEMEPASTYTYTREVGDYFIQRVAEGKSITKTAKELSLPLAVVMRWRAGHDDFESALQMAFKTRAETIRDRVLDEIEHGIDKDEAPGKRVVIDTLKWAAGVDDKNRFGTTKSEVAVTGGGILIVDTGIRREGDAGFSPAELDVGGDNGERRTIGRTEEVYPERSGGDERAPPDGEAS